MLTEVLHDILQGETTARHDSVSVAADLIDVPFFSDHFTLFVLAFIVVSICIHLTLRAWMKRPLSFGGTNAKWKMKALWTTAGCGMMALGIVVTLFEQIGF